MAFKVIIHHPEDGSARQALKKKAAGVHAQAVVEKIKLMSCPAEQKLRLIDAVKSRILE